MTRSRIVGGFFAAQLVFGAAVACGGNTPPADAPASSASAPASSAPAADTTPAVTSAPVADTAPPATSAAPTPPPPAPLPASFTDAQTAFFAQADKLSDAITGAGTDCGKMGAAMDKVASDKAFGATLKTYVAESLKLNADQRDVAKGAFDAQQKKWDGNTDAVEACKKNGRVKGAVEKVKKTMKDGLKPLMDAMTGAAPSAAPAGSAAPKK